MEETPVHILEKVRDIFLRYGIKSVTMDDLAREMGMSKKTLYQYINDKNDLIDKVVELEIETRQCEINKVFDKNLNAIEEVFEVNKHVINMLKDISPAAGFDLKKYYPDLFVKVQDSRRLHMLDSIVKNIEKGKQEGLYREEVDAEIIGKLNVMRFESLQLTDIRDREFYSSPRYIREVIIYHIRGLASEKGLQVLEEKIKDLDEYIESTKQ